MAGTNVWPMVHTERAALATDLQSLTDKQWATPSLCAGWSVREVLAHLTAAAEMTPPRFIAKLAGSGFRFNKMVAKDVAERVQGPPATTLARFEEHMKATTSPPGPKPTWLGEAIVHAEDIRRPLGIKRTYPVDALTCVADFYRGSNTIIGAKNRIAGVRLNATDADWSTGDGPEVSGPLVSLVVAMTGRHEALADLSGPGLETLNARF